jgi:GntR family transcriptional regulator
MYRLNDVLMKRVVSTTQRLQGSQTEGSAETEYCRCAILCGGRQNLAKSSKPNGDSRLRYTPVSRQELTREPIYQQLNQLLRSLVRSQEFPVGAQFLTERQVSERFQVSRATANKALSNLVAEGLLTFRKGVGTFVSPQSMDYNLRALVSFTEEAIAAGKRPETRVLRFEEVIAGNATEDIVHALQSSSQDKLWYLERLRLADGLPVILERRHIAARYCPALRPSDVAGSLYRVWKERYRLDVEGAEESIRAVNIRRGEATLLGARQNTAGLLVTSVGFLRGHEPLWFERTLYRGDAYEFHNRLAGIQPAGEPFGRFLSQ